MPNNTDFKSATLSANKTRNESCLVKDVVQSFKTDRGDQCTHRPILVGVTLLQTCTSSFEVPKQAIEQWHKQPAVKIYNCVGNRTIALQEPTLHGRRKQTERMKSLERNMKYWNA